MNSKFKEDLPLLILIVVILLALLLITSCAESCSRDPEQLNEKTREVFYELKDKAKKEGIDIKIICGYRSQEEQDKLYAQGRTINGKKVTWTRRSRHTEGSAFDIAVFQSGRISWKGEDYKEIGRIGKSLNLVWGGDWKVRDYGHFEIK